MNHGTPPMQAGDEFREDLRPLAATGARAGQGAAAARRVLGAQELAPLTRLNDCRSMGALAQSVGVSAAAIAFGLAVWPSPWVLAAVAVVGIQQHGFFILAHEAAHYRLLSNRRFNDVLGRLIGMAGGISMPSTFMRRRRVR